VIGDPWQRRRLLEAFPFLQATPEAFRAELFAQVALVVLPVGQLICHDGTHCTQLPLVLTGTGRVYKLGENGREITLYRVHPGESCVVTASCILSDRTFPAFAVLRERGRGGRGAAGRGPPLDGHVRALAEIYLRLDGEPLAGGLRRSRCGAVPAP
jgi:hypothetical protein